MIIATEYASWPDEDAADQTRSATLWGPCREKARQRLVPEMLKRLVVAEEEALVGGHRLHHLPRKRVIARLAQPFSERRQIAQLLALQDRRKASVQQIKLVGADHQSGTVLEQSGEGVEGES